MKCSQKFCVDQLTFLSFKIKDGYWHMIDLLDDQILFSAFTTYAVSFSHLNPAVQIEINDSIYTAYK